MPTSLRLIVEQVSVVRGGRLVLDAVSTAVTDGDALIVTGPNGAGKTTFLRAVAGLIAPETGVIRLEGGAVDDDVGRQCHYAAHLDAVKSRLTVAENLAFWARYLGAPPGPAPVAAALDAFDLADLAGVAAGYLSAGQRRRLGLARILVAHRPIWLLDEPTVSLDRPSITSFVQAIEKHRAARGIVIAATHVELGLVNARSLRLGAAA